MYTMHMSTGVWQAALHAPVRAGCGMGVCWGRADWRLLRVWTECSRGGVGVRAPWLSGYGAVAWAVLD